MPIPEIFDSSLILKPMYKKKSNEKKLIQTTLTN